MPALTPSAPGPDRGPAKLLWIVRNHAGRWFRPPLSATQPHPMPQISAVPRPQRSLAPRATPAAVTAATDAHAPRTTT
jgi:hypothetical protein